MLAPASVTYREALALHLADQGKPGEATVILAAVAPGHPMLALLGDLGALPAPPGSQHLVSYGLAFADYELVSKYSPGNLMRLRVRTHQLSTSFEQVQAFYQRKWPGFRLFRDEPKPGDKPEEGQFAHQYFRWVNGVLTQLSTLADVPETPTGGMMLGLVEVRNKGQRWRYLTILNFRQ
jgi:hypothetical protein